jgi:hypothetical protein
MSYNPQYGGQQHQYGGQQPQQYPEQWGAQPQNGQYQNITSPANAHFTPNPGYSAPYAPPSAAPPPQAYNNGYGNEKDPYANGRFKPEKRVNDIFFLILFLATLLGFAGLSGYVLRAFVTDNNSGGGIGKGNTGPSFTLNT